MLAVGDAGSDGMVIAYNNTCSSVTKIGVLGLRLVQFIVVSRGTSCPDFNFKSHNTLQLAFEIVILSLLYVLFHFMNENDTVLNWYFRNSLFSHQKLSSNFACLR